MLRAEETNIFATLILHRGNLVEGFQTFCHFQRDVCLAKIPGSSRPGQSIGMRLVFMLKELRDAISIHDEECEKKNTDQPPAFLICNRCQMPPQPAHNLNCSLCSWIMPQIGTQENNNGTCYLVYCVWIDKVNSIICLSYKIMSEYLGLWQKK